MQSVVVSQTPLELRALMYHRLTAAVAADSQARLRHWLDESEEEVPT